MRAAASSTVPSHQRTRVGLVFGAIPNGPGDVWSIAFAAIAFAFLFVVVKLLERV
jgi:hypothetical protein